MNNLDLFVNWNRALYSYFFAESTDDEVSLYINRETIDEIGANNGLGDYDSFIYLVTLSSDERQRLYTDLRRHYIGTNMSNKQRRLYRSNNLFDFATIFIDEELYVNLACPFLIYIVFTILMGSECHNNNDNAIGRHITDTLRNYFPRHTNNRDSLELLFNELSRKHPRFHARRLTQFPYIGLIKYQLGLSRAQEESLKKALYCADVSEDLPYEEKILRLREYVDNPMRDLLRRSRHDNVLKRRISDLIDHFDPLLYEQTHQIEEIGSKGSFILAIYQDDYSEKKDRLVLLTDVNNRTLIGDRLKIEKGSMDRLGEYAQYNVNHVIVGDNDKAEMRRYSLRVGDSHIRSVQLGNIVLFSRCSSNYLIQTKNPQRGKETYILVRQGHQDEFNEWLVTQGNPTINQFAETTYVLQVFGEGWDMYISSDLEAPNARLAIANRGTTITINGGIPYSGKYKVYLFNALPYFEFPEPIEEDRLSIYINIEDRNLEDYEYNVRIVDDTKLVIELDHLTITDVSQEMDITLEYIKSDNRNISYHDTFFICDQKMDYNEEDLLTLNLWNQIIPNEERVVYMKGYRTFNGEQANLPETSRLYQPSGELVDIYDHRFFLVNLIASRCSMMDGLFISDNQLKKCMRYAATRFGINIASDPNFYSDLKYMLINGGYINADFAKQRYQPLPPTFIKMPITTIGNTKMFMLVGSYTFKFLQDLKVYCDNRRVQVFLHNSNQDANVADLPQSILLPPVLLFQYNFDPEDFMRATGCICDYTHNEDVAVTMLMSMPSYQNYETSLERVPAAVFDTRLREPNGQRFPRIRISVLTGYGASRWIEMACDQYYRITNPDMAWAHLYCMYRLQDHMLTRNNSFIYLPLNLHLPVMMQRALFVINMGRPSKQKAFICNNRDSNDVYFNIIKVYDVNNSASRMPYLVQAVSGRPDDSNNPAVRSRINCRNYRLKLWYNRSKHSTYPRTLMVVSDNLERTIFGFAIKTSDGMKTYLRRNIDDTEYTLVNSDEMNRVFSDFMTTSRTFADMGITFGNETAQLPPVDLYEKENIQII